ncbi:hypothetical protein QBC41DRAFT_390206 [Cercophora samala]|uniref:Trichothecene 3-O-acetyltransferase-like N-terminal domain-containing protein n=1 Tax=Cercophora samala TaxID=330535 RepID=A0AA39ZFQ9_9PEZI|nr:hypothetical protein QBC41DRAFT_390206 [Cercophora samala]
MHTSRHIWTARLLETFPLTVIDQHAPVIYTRLVYGFRFPETTNIPAAVDYLRKGLYRVFGRWPFLAGQVVHTTDSTKAQLVYSKDPNDFNISVFPDEVFNHEILNKKKFPYTYEQLLDLGIPPSLMDKDVLSLSPNHPEAGESCHPLTLKANFIDGGLLLCIASHHTVCDGISLLHILETIPDHHPLPATCESESCIKLREDFNKNAFPPPQSYATSLLPPGYSPSSSTPLAPSASPRTAEILTFSYSKINDLCSAARTHLNIIALLSMAHHNTVHQSTTGLDLSSWSFLGADVKFGIPGTVLDKPNNGRADWVRKTWSAGEGSMNILPRRYGNQQQVGEVEEEGNWEILLAAREDDMAFVCAELRGSGLLASTTFGSLEKAK